METAFVGSDSKCPAWPNGPWLGPVMPRHCWAAATNRNLVRELVRSR